jgi:hypothetical protein
MGRIDAFLAGDAAGVAAFVTRQLPRTQRSSRSRALPRPLLPAAAGDDGGSGSDEADPDDPMSYLTDPKAQVTWCQKILEALKIEYEGATVVSRLAWGWGQSGGGEGRAGVAAAVCVTVMRP